MNNTILTFGTILLYLTCSILLFIYLNQSSRADANNKARLSKRIIVLVGFGGLLLHTLVLYSSMFSDAGINFGFYNAMSLVSVFLVLFTLTATWRHPVEILTIILLPITIVTIALEYFGTSSHLLPAGSSTALIFHVSTSIIAYSLLALAALQAILLSIQNKFLHAHQPGGLIKRLPPLKNMETLLFEVILAGFIMLTISLGSGLLFLENMFAQQLAHKTVLSILAWLVFLALLVGHWQMGWRGRTAIRWTLSGFISLMLAYFGSKFVLEILLT
ncbi:Inner membrane protein YpjD [hydrothermal vent metagenome]|uniref:Inner membrane protein YpjD n=1 Tax=hydrothermal vent metagenome TaxID=652676 RepID=A0A3B0WNG9_9ZZZZ